MPKYPVFGLVWFWARGLDPGERSSLRVAVVSRPLRVSLFLIIHICVDVLWMSSPLSSPSLVVNLSELLLASPRRDLPPLLLR